MSIDKLIEKYSVSESAMRAYIWDLKSPLGDLTAVADDKHLYILLFLESRDLDSKVKRVCSELNCKLVEDKNKLLEATQNELDDYFLGKLKNFTIPVKHFGTDFQQAVWAELRRVPYGATRTYSALASALGKERSARAAGSACGANAAVLVTPCHRVVGARGAGGYGPGLERKARLLRHEADHCN